MLDLVSSEDVYGNFLDHVPSDSTDYDASCICYKLPFGAFPEIDVSELTTPTPGRKKMRSLKPEGLRGLCLEVLSEGWNMRGGIEISFRVNTGCIFGVIYSSRM